MIPNSDGWALAEASHLPSMEAAHIIAELSCTVGLLMTHHTDEALKRIAEIERRWGREGLLFASYASVYVTHPGHGYEITQMNIYSLDLDGITDLSIDDLPSFHRCAIWFTTATLQGDLSRAHDVWRPIYEAGDAKRLLGILVRAVADQLQPD